MSITCERYIMLTIRYLHMFSKDRSHTRRVDHRGRGVVLPPRNKTEDDWIKILTDQVNYQKRADPNLS